MIQRHIELFALTATAWRDSVMKLAFPVVAFALIAGCAKPAHAPANDQAPIITDLNATAPMPTPETVAFVCSGTEDGSKDVETRHFVFSQGRLAELNSQSGKLEDVCEGAFPCQMTVDDTHIHVSQSILDKADATNIRKRVYGININRVTGDITQFDNTTLTLNGEPDPGWRFDYHGSCKKEPPLTSIKPKF